MIHREIFYEDRVLKLHTSQVSDIKEELKNRNIQATQIYVSAEPYEGVYYEIHYKVEVGGCWYGQI